MTSPSSLRRLRYLLTSVHKPRRSKCKRRNMVAARRIKLNTARWETRQQQAWDVIKRALEQTIITSYRDRRMQACLFTDASREGWAYTITQCPVGELSKPWHEQRHELLAVNSGKFRNAQARWDMPCKEEFPIRRAVKKHRHLLQGNVPFASVNNHQSLCHVFDKPARKSVVSVEARDRLHR